MANTYFLVMYMGNILSNKFRMRLELWDLPAVPAVPAKPKAVDVCGTFASSYTISVRG